MSISQIPKSALFQSIEIGGVVYGNVMVENSSKIETSPYGDIQDSNYLLIADIKNTPDYSQLKTLLKNGTVVKFDGLVHTVTSTETLWDRLNSKEHHIEVYLK